jgi:hypothetical protein
MMIRVAALLSALLFASTAPASERTARFLIPANDGYGLADCLVEGTSCGPVVAHAWCEAKGFRTAMGFGRADPTDVTASTASSSRSRSPVFVVTCTE